MNKKEFIEKLNGDLSMEYRSIVQYIQHVSAVKGAKYQQVLDELTQHLRQELDHALTLAKQIDFLGGTATNRIPRFDTETSAEPALQQDLDLEEKQLERYRERVGEANDLGIPDVAEALSPLMEQTQDHVRDLRAALST